MIEQHAIARIALTASVAGVLFLFALCFAFQAKEASIAEINGETLGWKVSVKGRIDSAFHGENFVFFKLNDGTGKIKAVIFNPSREQRKLIEKNRFVEVKGKVQLYKEKLEIVVEKVMPWH